MFLFRVSDCGLSFASYGFDQCDAAGFDQFLAAHGASAFARFGFDSDLVWVQAEDAGDAVADGVVVIGQLRALGITLPQPVVQTYSMHVRNRLLSTGRFLGLMWASALAFNQDGWSFKALPVRLDIPTRPVAIITLKNRTLSPAVELFVKQALETARSTKSRRSLAREAAC